MLIREIQRHPFRPELLHVDFFEIRSDVKIRVQVPIHLLGTAVGVEMGGILQQHRHEMEVECLPGEIPPGFEVDISGLDIGDAIHISDVDAGGVTVLGDMDETLCTIVPPAAEEVEEEEEVEEGAEEEVEAEEEAEE